MGRTRRRRCWRSSRRSARRRGRRARWRCPSSTNGGWPWRRRSGWRTCSARRSAGGRRADGVAGSFLGKFFAKPPARSEELASALRELDAARADRPAFREPLAALQAILPILAEPADDAAGFTLDPELARTKLTGGVPLLRGEALPVDAKRFRRRWQRIAAAVPGGEPLTDALKRGQLEPGELIAAVPAGEPGRV